MNTRIQLNCFLSNRVGAFFRPCLRPIGLALLPVLLAAGPVSAQTVWNSSSSYTGSLHPLGKTNIGYVIAEFDVTPATAAINGVIGYAGASTKVSGASSSALAIRLNSTNTFDVCNGSAYGSLATVAYAAQSAYHVKVAVDFVGKKYSVWVTPPGGLVTEIAADYAFRSGAPAISDLGQVGLVSPGNLQFSVANHTVTVAPSAPVATVLFSDGFESKNFTKGGWTNSSATVQSGAKYAGSYAASFNKTASISKAFSTAGSADIVVSYARDVVPTGSTKHFVAEWYNGSVWQTLEDVTAKSGWTVRTWILSAESADNPSFAVRFRVAGYGSSDYAYVDEVNIISFGQSLLSNSGFEVGSPANWYTTSWQQTSTYTWETGTGLGGTHCASIQSLASNDASWTQDVQLVPGGAYDVTGWIKGNAVAMAPGDGIDGANLSLLNAWFRSDNLVGTFPWQQAKFTFLAPADGKATIGARLGFYGSTDTGKAWFDNIVLSPMSNRRQSSHFIFDLEPADTAAFTGTNYDRWMGHIDNMYSAYQDLVGGAPYGGAKIELLSILQSPDGAQADEAIDGNPIQWWEIFVHDELGRCNNDDNWSFGVMHEIGHDFDIGGWNWWAEFFANFKMYYGVDTLNAKFMQNGIYYTGSQAATYYQTDSSQSYSKTIAQGTFAYDGLTYCFIRIRNQIGWAPFKSTFRYYLSSGAAPVRHIDNFNLFLNMLTQYSGFDVRSTFLPGELQTCVNAISAEN